MNNDDYSKWEKDKTTAFKAKLGIWMFLGYSIIYAGFILINVINPKLMELDIGSLNLAIVYGLGLILIALVMALIYNRICANAERKMDKEADKKNINGESEVSK